MSNEVGEVDGGSVSVHGMWSSRLIFILAAAGSAVGLGNIWKFPYVAGENGGGAFVLVYLACVALIGVPIMMAEVLLGRAGRQSPINSMAALVARSRVSPLWNVIGWMGVLTGFLILSFYSVIAGWVIQYVVTSAQGTLVGADKEMAKGVFNSFVGDWRWVLFWHTLFMAVTALIVARGVGRGLETAVKYLMPALFLLMVLLIGYAMTTGHFFEGLSFLFRFQPEQLGWNAVLEAMGQAFFTLSLGMAAIMAYGAYMPQEARILPTVGQVALLDTLVAMMAGVAIFPIVFAHGLEPAAGPGLMFEVLPLAFGNIAGGQLFATLFFVLVMFAAVTSSISLVEPAVAFLIERVNFSRPLAALVIGGVSWFIGIGSVLSFSVWSKFYLVGGMTFFDCVDYLTSNIMLPLGGMLIAIFAGWIVDKSVPREELALSDGQYRVWQFLVRFIGPAAILLVTAMTLFG